MNKEIDLSKYNLRTDIALEQIDNDIVIEKEEYEENGVLTTKIVLDKNNKDYFNKPEGKYITLRFKDVSDSNNFNDVQDALTKELTTLINTYNLKKEDNILIVGLGNKNSTPDSLGPKVVEEVIVTRHMFLLNNISDNFQNTSAISFGVTGTTGIETSQAILAITEKTKPKLVIVIDALASSLIENLNKTIQITTAGISPGSGVGNSRMEISKDTLGVDVIAIGIPTVVDSLTIISSSFTYIYKYLAYTLSDSKKRKLAIPNSINYLKEEVKDLDSKNKEAFLGIMGTLTDDELKVFIKEVIEPIDMNLIVTPKEVDFTIKKLSNIISNSLNNTLHRQDI